MADPISLVVGPLVNIVIEKATSLIDQNFQSLTGVEKDVKTLSSTLTSIQSVLKDAEDKQLHSEQLRDWLGKLKAAAYDSQDVLETFETDACLWQRKQQVRNCHPPFSGSKISYKLEAAREIKDILVRLDEIAREKEKFNLNVNVINGQTDESRNTSSLVVEADVVGREDDKNKIVDQLLSKEFDREGDISVIPVIGMGGLGKTTLAQVVYNDDRVKKHFEFMMWVCVGVDFNYRRILKEMIEYHSTMNYDNINALSDEQLESRLLSFFARKSFFLVLDDVWIESYDAWDKLQKVLKQGGKGSRVLITSRNTRVANLTIGTQRPYCLDYLPEDQCWMHDLIHGLAQSVYYQVKDNESCHVSESHRHVSLLCENVENLALEITDKSKRLRTLLFPSEHHKVFGQALDKLFRNLKYIRVLDLSSSTLGELPNSIKELKLLHYLDLSKTEITALPNSICSLYNLQTLKLLGCFSLFELPKHLSNLVNLEHLELDDMFWFKSSTLPPRMGCLTRLQNLHAFQIKHNSGYGIDELKDMKCLKGTLHISKLENATNAAEAKLKDKEKLEKVVFEWSNSDGDPQHEATDESVLEDLQPHSNLKVLQLLCYKGTRFPSWIRDGLLQKLVNLSFNHCSNIKVLSLGRLEHLKELHIKGMLELEEWPEADYISLHTLKISNCPKLICLPSLFPDMEVLKIKKCDSLKTLPLTPFLCSLTLVDNLVLEDWNEKLEPIFFINDQGQREPLHSVNDQGETVEVKASYFRLLTDIKIVNCPKLLPLPKSVSPEKLEISGCQQLNTLPELSLYLQHLALDGCHGETLLRAIPNTDSLFSLVISNISGITHLPKLPQLSGLKALYIHYCSDLVSLFEEESSFQGLSSLKLLSIWNCPQLVTLLSQGLPATIECLSIGSCHSLMSLGPNEGLKNLTSLRDLYIDDCPALLSLPEEGLATSLQHLHIEGCPLLLKECQNDVGPNWLNIKDIPDLEIEHPNSKTKVSSPAWYRQFICCIGIDSENLSNHNSSIHRS
ncbi:hypothetical protein TEA_025003 [Camellia sinensis var. sinensis]|uniref:Rx N-terminal domain-containing protein n=1 Tax=Camellia sinensis var. sinensis TaxID=542762 RepID=A0A4S4DG61_CAMSN|nr:hypothetical protein TEA_025003 [Camellia sinensis var. sinensis]